MRNVTNIVVLASVLTFLLPFGVLSATTDYSVRASASNGVITFPGTGPETNSSSNNLTTITATSSAGFASSLPLNSSNAIASLDSASIRGAVSATSIDNKQADASFSGEIRDYITFDLPDGLDTATITAVFDIAGELSASQDLSAGGLLLQSWDISATLRFGSANADDNGSLLSQPNFEPAFTRQLSVDWDVTEGEPVYLASKLTVVLRANAGGMLFDFNGVGDNQLSFVMPEGTTFTSASGAFLTAAPVPIPASIWFLGSVLAGLFFQSRETKRTLG